MDYSIQDVMNDLVATDAARMSGARFADARGTGVARRVRTRRTVRAAGVGGASAVAVGSLALGAAHVPWGSLDAAPGIGDTDCVTPSPSTGHVRYTVSPAEEEQIRSMTSYYFPDYDGTDVDQYWYNFDPSTGTPALEVSHMKDGKWFVTIGSDEAQQVEPDEAGAVSIDISVAGVVTTYHFASTLGTLSVHTTTSSVAGGSPLADDCFTPSPTPSSVPSATPSTDPSSSPDPNLAAKPDDVIGDSPFECGFEFPTESYSTATQSIDDVERVRPDEINAVINNLPPGFGLAGAQAIGQDDILWIAVRDTFGYPYPEWVRGGGEAIDPMTMLDASDPDAPASGVRTAHGSTFVAVADGNVVGTIVDPSVPVAAPPVYRWIHGADFDESLVLLNPDNAFTACPGATLDGDWDLYAVAGDVYRESNGTYVGPDYFWLKVGKP